MSETPSNPPIQTPAEIPVNPALTTPQPPNPNPAATTPEASKSIIGGSQAEAWKEYTPDATKTAEENAALKEAHDKTKPAPAEAPKPVPAAEFAPIKFTDAVKLPEGFAPPTEQITEFETILNDPNLTRAQLAQKLVDFQAKNLTALTTSLSEKGKESWETLQNDWHEQCQKDPVIGGENLPKAEAAIGRLLDSYGDRETRAVFDLTGAGNHPAMVKFLTKIASKLNEPAPPPPPNPGRGEADAARVMFPTMK